MVLKLHCIKDIALNGQCDVYRVINFPNPISAGLEASIDGYNATIGKIDLVANYGDRAALSADTAYFRDIPLCIHKNGDQTSVAYKLSTTESPRYKNPIVNTISFLITAPTQLDRSIVMEFQKEQLTFVGLTEDFGNSWNLNSSVFVCGRAAHARN